MNRRSGTVCTACFVSILGCLALAAPALAQCDVAAPALTSFSFSPASVNTTSNSASVTCTMIWTDDLAGVESSTCQLRSADALQSESCTATTPTSGTPLNGTYTCTVTLPRYSRSGSWSVASVSATDEVGNDALFTTLDLMMRGFPTTLIVTSDPDTVAPQLGAFTFSPTSVDVRSASKTVTCTMPVTDAKSGVDVASCIFGSPSESQFQVCSASAPTSGTRTNGTFQCTVTIPRYSEQGTWVVEYVQLIDMVNNFKLMTTADLAAAGRPTNLSVTSTPDVSGPTLTNLTLTPQTIDTTSALQVVACTMTFADSPAGTSMAMCSFDKPATGHSYGCQALAPSSGTPQNGTWSCNVTFPVHAPGGTYEATITAIDTVTNESTYDRAQLQGLGLPSTISNACSGGGEVETTLGFADADTLTWTAVTGAIRYGVYRGETSAFVDFNFDGLPDGGYGFCQNSNDPNVTDTQYVDTEVPPEGEPAFTYLVSYRDASGEHGLGSTSEGLPRSVFLPCP
ncbi:MAG: hypothetical protein KBD01_03315 [Acidobacteria bacterium]|nr:hypothetical protein [Acidobacteriota bacterium]